MRKQQPPAGWAKSVKPKCAASAICGLRLRPEKSCSSLRCTHPSRSGSVSGRFLAHNGRWMIGLVFLFATLWKAWLSPEFTTGVAFRVTLLVDPRFEDFTRLAAGVPLEWIEAQRALLARHADGAQVAIGLTEVPRRLAWIAWIGTCWTLLVEGLVALCFLWPLGRGPSTGRDWLLMCFCATTYSVATVASFGWLLVAMGFSQCDPAKRRTRLVYGLLFALILFYREVPWLSLAADRWAPG